MGTIYALITTHCNLSCPHCDIKNCNEYYDRDKFIDQLNKFDGSIILFGGEPTLYPDRLLDIYLSNPIINRKITSISTNLISFNDKILTLFQLIKHISTSWNLNRFNDEEYEKWLNNINIIGERIPDIKIRVLITMTEDLLKLSSDQFNDIIAKWNCNVINDIHFEHYVSDDVEAEYFNRCDEWLCSIYKGWKSKIKMNNINLVDNWYFDCSNVYTLYPDGNVKKGCPHNVNIKVPSKCYTCEKSDQCRPCQLQKYCSYPSNFIKLIKEEKEK